MPAATPAATPSSALDPVAGSISAYDRHAASYAAWAAGFSLSVPLATFVAAVPSGAAVLDAGCGSGRDLAALAGVGVPCVGVDRSAGLLGHAAGPRTQADLRTLPFRDDAFGGVWSCASLVHLDPAGVAVVLREYVRVLRPGGVLEVTVKAGVGEGDWSETDHGARWFYYWPVAAFRAAVEQAGGTITAVDTTDPRWIAVQATT